MTNHKWDEFPSAARDWLDCVEKNRVRREAGDERKKNTGDVALSEKLEQLLELSRRVGNLMTDIESRYFGPREPTAETPPAGNPVIGISPMVDVLEQQFSALYDRLAKYLAQL